MGRYAWFDGSRVPASTLAAASGARANFKLEGRKKPDHGDVSSRWSSFVT
jgi:hypothetical protein